MAATDSDSDLVQESRRPDASGPTRDWIRTTTEEGRRWVHTVLVTVVITVGLYLAPSFASPAVSLALSVSVVASLWVCGPGLRKTAQAMPFLVCAAAVLVALGKVSAPLQLVAAVGCFVLPPVRVLMAAPHPRRARAVGLLITVPLLLTPLILLATRTPAAVLQVLGWGYDNAAHIGSMGDFLLSGGPPDFGPESMVSYPQGTYSVWNALGVLSGLGFTKLSGDQLASAYAVLAVATTVAFVASTAILTSALVSRQVEVPRRVGWPQAASAAVVVLCVVVLGSPSHLLWSGWLPFLLGLALSMCYLATVLGAQWSRRAFLAHSAASFLAVGLVYPLLLPLVVAGWLGWMSESYARRTWKLRVGVWALWTAGGVLTLAASLVVVGRLVPNALEILVSGGGMEPPTSEVNLAVLATGVWVLGLALARHDWAMSVMLGVVASATALLCAYAYIVSGGVPYYPLRLYYALLIVILCSGIALLATYEWDSWELIPIGAVPVTLMVVTMVHAGVYPQFFVTPFMGSTPQVLPAIRGGLMSAPTPVCGTQSHEGAIALERNPKAVAVVVNDTFSATADLPSRWPNRLEYRGDSATQEFLWSLPVPLSATDLADAIRTRVESGGGPVVVVARTDDFASAVLAEAPAGSVIPIVATCPVTS